jgi:hypothetical protein
MNGGRTGTGMEIKKVLKCVDIGAVSSWRSVMDFLVVTVVE